VIVTLNEHFHHEHKQFMIMTNLNVFFFFFLNGKVNEEFQQYFEDTKTGMNKKEY